MFVVVVEFRIRSAHVQEFHRAILENARLSVQEEAGCHQFDVCRDPAEPGLFFLYEIYDDETAFQVHLQSAHFQRMNAATAGWVESKQVRTLQRVQP